MNKIVLMTAMTLISQLSQACLGEAQIIAEVSAVEQTAKECLVSVNPTSVRFFSENQTCPLALEDVLSTTVRIAAKDNGACAVQAGGELNGVVVLKADGSIELE